MNNLALIEECAALLFLADLAFFAAYRRVVLGEGYWPGSRLARGTTQALVAAVWIAGSLSLLLHVVPLAGALTLAVLFRVLYIRSRWTGLFRGGGAPGFMSHYLAIVIAVVTASQALDASGRLTAMAVLLVQIDFAVILLCSGTYKSLSGYLHGEGMEYGLANPMWGHHFDRFRRLRPSNPFLRLQDVAAATGQLAMGALMLVPGLRWAGGLLCIVGFFGLMFLVRLGRLAVLMMVVPLMYLPELDLSLTGWLGSSVSIGAWAMPAGAVDALRGAMIAYLVVLVAVKAMQYANLFLRRTYRQPLQRWLTRYANAVPIIMWRVFTPDVTNFFVRIQAVDPASGELRPLVDEASPYRRGGRRGVGWSLRFLNVSESIVLTTVFTTRKYFPSKPDLFRERLVAYARSLLLEPTIVPSGTRTLRFEHVAIEKHEDGFVYVPSVELLVDVVDGTVRERPLRDAAVFDPATYSHIKETTGYGSYVPA